MWSRVADSQNTTQTQNMLIDFHLGHQAEYTLTYELFNNRVAERIWHRQKETGHLHEYVSRTEFYNWGETEQDVRERLKESVAKIKELAPDLDFNHSDDLNTLHINFPDLLAGAQGELAHWLSMFNYHIHHLEDITRGAKRRFLTCAHEDTHNESEELCSEDYDLFTTEKRYGYLYMNYPHVGKHIAELYFDNDADVPSHQIVPTSILKNDFYSWFDSDTQHDSVKLKKVIQRWCLQITHKLPFSPDDPRMAIGYIPIGKLTVPVDHDKIAENRYIHSVLAR